MGMTMTQKILAAHAGLESVEAGQLIEANLDLVLANDITGPVAIHEVEKLNKKTVFDKDKVALVPDHFAPNKDIKSAEHCKCVREYAKEHGITNYFEVGQMGIEHALLPEKGLIVAGETCIGADSHTCTYGALGAFSTGVGSTDMGCGMITGQAWFKVPSAIKFILTGKPSKWVSGKDVILHIIGMIGVDGALYKSMEFRLVRKTAFSLWMKRRLHIWKNIRRRNIRFMRPTRMRCTMRSIRLTLALWNLRWHSHTFLRIQRQSVRPGRLLLIRLLSVPAQMGALRTCAPRRKS